MAKPGGHRDFYSRSHSGSCAKRKDKRGIERGSEGHSPVGSISLVSCQSQPPTCWAPGLPPPHPKTHLKL